MAVRVPTLQVLWEEVAVPHGVVVEARRGHQLTVLGRHIALPHDRGSCVSTFIWVCPDDSKVCLQGEHGIDHWTAESQPHTPVRIHQGVILVSTVGTEVSEEEFFIWTFWLWHIHHLSLTLMHKYGNGYASYQHADQGALPASHG